LFPYNLCLQLCNSCFHIVLPFIIQWSYFNKLLSFNSTELRNRGISNFPSGGRDPWAASVRSPRSFAISWEGSVSLF
jgi:hypothetical protein